MEPKYIQPVIDGTREAGLEVHMVPRPTARGGARYEPPADEPEPPDDLFERPMTWAEWCCRAHERPLPAEVLPDVPDGRRGRPRDQAGVMALIGTRSASQAPEFCPGGSSSADALRFAAGANRGHGVDRDGPGRLED